MEHFLEDNAVIKKYEEILGVNKFTNTIINVAPLPNKYSIIHLNQNDISEGVITTLKLFLPQEQIYVIGFYKPSMPDTPQYCEQINARNIYLNVITNDLRAIYYENNYEAKFQLAINAHIFFYIKECAACPFNNLICSIRKKLNLCIISI